MTLMSFRSQSVTKALPETLYEVHRSAQRSAPALATGITVVTMMSSSIDRPSSVDTPASLVSPGGDRVRTYERGCAQ